MMQHSFEFLDTIEKQVKQRFTSPIDLIYTTGKKNANAVDDPTYVQNHCCLAVYSGWSYGVQSTGCGGVCATAVVHDKHKPIFIDNKYDDYNHELHVAAVKRWKPKYATVRDVMTREQCQKAGIEYYPLEQILDWAAELQEHAENVIVIPKYDCLDQIPEPYMLGYSVPTSHGGTPLPIETFAGRKVHLLGGSWKNQLKYLYRLPEWIVSIDNNYVFRLAKHGKYNNGIGQEFMLSTIMQIVPNPLPVCLSISLANIVQQIEVMYGE